MKEEWRDIEGYEGLYQVSNLGRIKSFLYHNGTNERIIKPIQLKNKHKYESKSVLQYDLNNNFIKQWNSIADVERELNITHCNIVACLKNRRNNAGGFIWKYT